MFECDIVPPLKCVGSNWKIKLTMWRLTDIDTYDETSSNVLFVHFLFYMCVLHVEFKLVAE